MTVTGSYNASALWEQSSLWPKNNFITMPDMAKIILSPMDTDCGVSSDLTIGYIAESCYGGGISQELMC